MKNFGYLLWVLVLFVSSSCNRQTTSLAQPDNAHTVVVLSLDGFRWDYPEKTATPNLARLAQLGVRAEAIRPAFPSKTFPNHYTLATGLYPGNHGLVNNTFTEHTTGLVYSIGNREAVSNAVFYGGEPIWNTVEKAGKRAACFYWVGSEAPVQGMRPSIWKSYDGAFPWQARADSVIAWLSRPAASRPHLIMWYLAEPDHQGHMHGPNGTETIAMVSQLDQFVGRFLDQLQALPNAAQIDFILTTDHGMGEISTTREVVLENHLSKDQLQYIHTGNPVVLVEPKPEYFDQVLARLQKVPHLRVVRKGEAPAAWHYSNHPNMASLTLVADSAWSLNWKASSEADTGGTHGYDPANKDMHGIFYAFGPSFKRNYQHPAFDNVHFYSLLAHLLNVTPAANDGNLAPVREMLTR